MATPCLAHRLPADRMAGLRRQASGRLSANVARCRFSQMLFSAARAPRAAARSCSLRSYRAFTREPNARPPNVAGRPRAAPACPKLTQPARHDKRKPTESHIDNDRFERLSSSSTLRPQARRDAGSNANFRSATSPLARARTPACAEHVEHTARAGGPQAWRMPAGSEGAPGTAL